MKCFITPVILKPLEFLWFGDGGFLRSQILLQYNLKISCDSSLAMVASGLFRFSHAWNNDPDLLSELSFSRVIVYSVARSVPSGAF